MATPKRRHEDKAANASVLINARVIDPASEYEETENKARALRQALEMAAADLL